MSMTDFCYQHRIPQRLIEGRCPVCDKEELRLARPIIHFYFEEHRYKNKKPVYLCNWAVTPKPEKLAKRKGDVTCKNCLRILKNFPMKDW